MNSEMSTYYNTNMILLALKIAKLDLYVYQHENKLFGRFTVWLRFVNVRLYKYNSPVGIPNSLLPLPRPWTTSPRQKYGGKLVTTSERISVPKYQSTKRITVEVMFVSRVWETADQKSIMQHKKVWLTNRSTFTSTRYIDEVDEVSIGAKWPLCETMENISKQQSSDKIN